MTEQAIANIDAGMALGDYLAKSKHRDVVDFLCYGDMLEFCNWSPN